MKNLWIIVLALSLFIGGCDEKQKAMSDIPKKPIKPVQLAEQPEETYDYEKFGELHIPKNCEIRCIWTRDDVSKYLLIINSSGTQFIIKAQNPILPTRVMKDQIPMW